MASAICLPDVISRQDYASEVSGDMAFAVPKYTREEINKAGDCLIADDKVVWIVNRDQMLAIINNWRSSHAFPLQSFKMALLDRARKIDPKAIIAQRLKRLPSIQLKLQRFKEMRLSQMQDLGGCRAVVRNMRRLESLIKVYEKTRSKNPKSRHEFIHEKDYIAHPKDDGYRGVHLIYRYQSTSPRHRVYNGLKIEIQLRSRLQHAWATAVETVSLFTGQALKSSGGEAEWRRFFALMSNAIALRERKPFVPGTPTDKETLIKELRELTEKLSVQKCLRGWAVALKRLPAKNVTDAVAFLVVLNLDAWTLSSTGFKKEDLTKASEAYLAVEKAANPAVQAVLVSLESVHSLRSAYPNYYLDATTFINALDFAIR
jgi:RelA/SpoT family protein